MLEPKSYSDRLMQSETEKDLQEISFRVKEAKLQLEADKLQTQQALSQAERELEKAKSAFPFSAVSIVQKIDTIESLKKGLEYLSKIESELFP